MEPTSNGLSVVVRNPNETCPVRFVLSHGVPYLRVDDVVDIILKVADTEETDVRNRLYTLARNLRPWMPPEGEESYGP